MIFMPQFFIKNESIVSFESFLCHYCLQITSKMKAQA